MVAGGCMSSLSFLHDILSYLKKNTHFCSRIASEEVGSEEMTFD